jgi:hypothetical protein
MKNGFEDGDGYGNENRVGKNGDRNFACGVGSRIQASLADYAFFSIFILFLKI